MPDDNYLSTFIAECAENLSTVENDLVELERSGASVDAELINRIFRAAHSIKGGAGFLELDAVKELAHRLESVLDMIRSGSLVPDPEVTSILLRGFDRLGELVQVAGSEARIDATEELDSLTGLIETHLPRGKESAASAKCGFSLPSGGRVLEAGFVELGLAAKAGKSLLMLRFDLIHDVQRMGKTPFDILASLGKQGDVLDCIVDFESAGTLDDEELGDSLPFFLLFASSASVIRIAKENDLPLAGITALDLPVEAKVVPMGPGVSAASPPAPIPETERRTGERRKAERRDTERRDTERKEAREESARISLALLDKLMASASELVLARNELLESLRSRTDDRAANAAARRIDQVTREIQAAVTQTRMQPIGSLFDRYPRLVRDLARETGKILQLSIEGREVEVDRTILEALSDPLLHLVRNACDHGVEGPEARKRAGKSESGSVAIRARHESGTVVVEVEDDGAGIDAEAVAAKAVSLGLIPKDRAESMSEKDKQNLILLPGLSTSASITDISGRGVGMDVVKTNVDRLGGQMEIVSERGRGSSFRLRLPLTLAIIPSLLVSEGGERYAIPETNVEELLHVRKGDPRTRIERVGDAELLVLRGEFIPLLRLGELLGSRAAAQGRSEAKENSIVVVNSRTVRYALEVDELHDTVEIVVKPLGKHFAKLREYSGATILGNGRTALILDTTGLAAKADFAAFGTAKAPGGANEEKAEEKGRALSLLTFGNGQVERCAVPLEAVDRVVKLQRSAIDRVGASRVFAYDGSVLPLFELSDALEVDECLASEEELYCIIFKAGERRFGLVASPPVDSTSETIEIDPSSFSGEALRGSAIIGGRATLVVDIGGFAAMLKPDWFGAARGEDSAARGAETAERRLVLVADDSTFFRDRVCEILDEAGYEVLSARDGEEALGLFKTKNDAIDACLFDLEMPCLDGFELIKRLRSSGAALPAIALTSLASKEDERRALDAGFDSFLVKLDREELLETVKALIEAKDTEGVTP